MYITRLIEKDVDIRSEFTRAELGRMYSRIWYIDAETGQLIVDPSIARKGTVSLGRHFNLMYGPGQLNAEHTKDPTVVRALSERDVIITVEFGPDFP